MIQKLSRPGEEGIPERRMGTPGCGCWATGERDVGKGPSMGWSAARQGVSTGLVRKTLGGRGTARTRPGVGQSREPMGTSARPGGRGVQFVLPTFAPLSAQLPALGSSFCSLRLAKNSLRSALCALLSAPVCSVRFAEFHSALRPAICPSLITSLCRKWKWEGWSGQRGGNRQWTQMNANRNLKAQFVGVGSVAGGNLFTSFCRISLRSAPCTLPFAPHLFSSICRKWKWAGWSGQRGGNRQWTPMNANRNLKAEFVGAGSVVAGNLFTSFCRISLRQALSALLPAPCARHLEIPTWRPGEDDPGEVGLIWLLNRWVGRRL